MKKHKKLPSERKFWTILIGIFVLIVIFVSNSKRPSQGQKEIGAEQSLTEYGSNDNFSINREYVQALCVTAIYEYILEDGVSLKDIELTIEPRSEVKSRIYINKLLLKDKTGTWNPYTVRCDIMSDGLLVNVRLINRQGGTILATKDLGNKTEWYEITKKVRLQKKLPPVPIPPFIF